MDDSYRSLGCLFELSRDAVIGIEDNKICFANPTARAWFDLDECDPHVFFPASCWIETDESYVTRASVGGRDLNVSVSRMGALRLLCMSADDRTLSSMEMSDLKTVRTFSDYLSEIRMALDAIMRRFDKDTKTRIKGYSSILYRDYFRLQRLCTHLSAAANVSAGTLPFNPHVIDLSKVVRDLIDSAAVFSEYFSADISLSVDHGDYLTYADDKLIETMILNLLTNSLLHCTEGDSVSIELKTSDKRYILSIIDNGKGISSSSLLNVFDPNGEPDLKDGTSGAGLGMMIANGIAIRHGGSIIVGTGKDGGCSIRITIPHTESPETVLHSPLPVDTARSMNMLYTELSVVLPKESFESRFMD